MIDLVYIYVYMCVPDAADRSRQIDTAQPDRRAAASRAGPQLVLNILLSVQPCLLWILSIIAWLRLGAWLGLGLGLGLGL